MKANMIKVERTKPISKDEADFSPARTAVLISGGRVGSGGGGGIVVGGTMHASSESKIRYFD